MKKQTQMKLYDKNQLYNWQRQIMESQNEQNLYWQNTLHTIGNISDFFAENLNENDQKEIKRKWKFMMGNINEELKKVKEFTMKQHIIISLYIKNYLNALFDYIAKDKLEEFVDFSLQVLKK